MKIDKNSQFDHPILKEEKNSINPDFINDTFDVVFEVVEKNKGNQIAYKYLIKTNNSSLEKLIIDGKAKAAFHIYCVRTFNSITVDADYGIKSEYALTPLSIFDNVLVLPIIYITEDIDGCKLNGLHEDYPQSEFNLKKGELIAIGDKRKVTVGRDTSDLEGIIKIWPNENNKDEKNFKIDIENDFIVILVNEKELELIKKIENEQFGETVITLAIHLPVLVRVFDIIKSGGAGYSSENNTWYKTLRDSLLEKNIDLDDPETFKNIEPYDIVQDLYKIDNRNIYADLENFLISEGNKYES